MGEHIAMGLRIWDPIDFGSVIRYRKPGIGKDLVEAQVGKWPDKSGVGLGRKVVIEALGE